MSIFALESEQADINLEYFGLAYSFFAQISIARYKFIVDGLNYSVKSYRLLGRMDQNLSSGL